VGQQLKKTVPQVVQVVHQKPFIVGQLSLMLVIQITNANIVDLQFKPKVHRQVLAVVNLHFTPGQECKTFKGHSK
jgi:hypothetical protein